MEGWEIIQSCKMTPELYGKSKFISAIQDLNSSDFDRFCKAYLHLMEFYTLHKNAWFTDDTDLKEKNPHSFWKPSKIDFETPIIFIRRE